MNQLKAGDISDTMLLRKFGDCLCVVYGASPHDYTELAWRLGASRWTPIFRPIILFCSPDYFHADEGCLDLIYDCRRRSDVVGEVRSFRHSYRHRGGWRYLGVGLSGRRRLKAFHRVAIASAAQSTLAGISISENRQPVNQSSPQS